MLKTKRDYAHDAVGGGRTRLKADVHPAPALPRGSFQEKRLIVNEDEPRMDTEETQIDHLLQPQAAPKCICKFVSLV